MFFFGGRAKWNEYDNEWSNKRKTNGKIIHLIMDMVLSNPCEWWPFWKARKN